MGRKYQIMTLPKMSEQIVGPLTTAVPLHWSLNIVCAGYYNMALPSGASGRERFGDWEVPELRHSSYPVMFTADA